jgi:tRNA(fMet)-specific endonuclease VapC
MAYVLDTNILSHLARNPQGPIASRIREVGESAVGTSIVVASEMRYGARKKGSAQLEARLEAILAAMEVLPLESPADVFYAAIRCRLERAGTPVGGNDLLLAAQVMALERVLVTDNEREFARIEGLRWENWLRAQET